jgi:amino acid adenylation domain-containing protein
MERFLGHLHVLLGSAIERPAEQVRALPILSGREQEELLDWNSTDAPCPDATLHELVAAWAVERPDAVAVEGEDECLTYDQLDRRSSQLAHRLVTLGVEPGALVGICVERSAGMMVALLGVLKTGAAYVPLDPTYPAERQAFMLADAQVPVLLTEQRLLEALPEHSAEVVCVDGIRDELERLPPTSPGVHVGPDDVAYVIYTSGSTGRPKGVEIRHRSVVNLLEHMKVQPGLSTDDVVVNLTTFAFDLSVPDLYLPLTCGAKLVVLPRESTFDGVELATRLEQAQATFVQATPTTWQLLVDAGWAGSRRLKVVCGGEPLSRNLAEELLRRGESLWHMYGPTETTVWSSIRRLETGEGPPPIGGPIANTRFYVLDDALQLNPRGVSGQLYIGGAGVARGYRGRPDLTGEKFVEDPFVGRSGERMYATGDFVRRRNDETLEFLGRIDHQVKLRGFRVELPEIEAVLTEHPGVHTAVAVVREDTPGDPRLVAYVTLDDPGVQPHELRRHLVDRLPPYMVPSAFVTLDELPETSNRKVDRTALPAPGTARPVSGRSYVAPRTPLEKLVAAAWGEVLGLSTIGVDDDFFELGGNSLLATQVFSRLQRELAISLPLRRIFELPRLADLAESIVETMAALALEEGDDVSALLGELEQEVSR